MAACEKCWKDYQREQLWGNGDVTYSEVVKRNEDERGACTPEEQCGELHVVLEYKDGTRHCRCGVVQDNTP